MTDILKTSRFIRNLHEYDDEDSEQIDYKKDAIEAYRIFIKNKNITLSETSLLDILDKCNYLYNNKYFHNFKKPNMAEYFTKNLRFLLLMDFIITFFKIDNTNFDIQKVPMSFIFDFFKNLSNFYFFINYLDVDEKFTTYLKFMMTLYCMDFNRVILESNFGNIIGILDEFFSNEIVKLVFKETNYLNYSFQKDKLLILNKINKKYPEIKNYDENINYSELCNNNNIDKLFKFNDNNAVITRTFYYKSDENKDDDDDYDEDDYEYDDDYWNEVKLYYIAEDDPKYEEYKNIFLFKTYQNIKKNYDTINDKINKLCNKCQINNYTSLFENEKKNTEMLIILTILGYNIDKKELLDMISEDINKFEFNYFTPSDDIYMNSCKYGNLEVFKTMVSVENFLSEQKVIMAIQAPDYRFSDHLRFLSIERKDIRNLLKSIHNLTYNKQKINFKA